MEERASTGDPYRTRWQRELVSQLGTYDRRSATAYEGVLHILHGEKCIGWESLVAYGLRDVIDILTETEEDGTVRRMEKKSKALARRFERSTGDGHDLKPKCSTLAGMLDRLSSIAHRRIRVTERDLIRMADDVGRILHVLTAPREGIRS